MISAVVRDIKSAVKAEESFNSWEVENKRVGEMFWWGDLIWVLQDM